MTVAITREEPGAVERRREAARCRDARAARRMLALALVLDGSSREDAARAAGMDRQTPRDWGHPHDPEGPPGPRARHRRGREPRLTPGQEAELATAVERGPDPERDGVVRWRRVDLRALIVRAAPRDRLPARRPRLRGPALPAAPGPRRRLPHPQGGGP